MVCLIEMDEGTPSIHPQPKQWMMANDIEEMKARLKNSGESLVVSQLEKITDEDHGKHWIVTRNMEVQAFLLVS